MPVKLELDDIDNDVYNDEKDNQIDNMPTPSALSHRSLIADALRSHPVVSIEPLNIDWYHCIVMY